MFVFYFAVMSAITPPVALAAYAAAGVAGVDPFKTGITAFQLGIAAFIVPFMFMYSPELMMVGSAGAIAFACVTAVIGVYLLSSYGPRLVCGWSDKSSRSRDFTCGGTLSCKFKFNVGFNFGCIYSFSLCDAKS